MSNRHDEIKNLIKASRDMLSSRNSLSETYEIKKQYNIILEQGVIPTSGDITKKINVGRAIEDELENDEESPRSSSDMPSSSQMKSSKSPRDKRQAYRISGGVLVLHGKNQSELEVTTDEKVAFQETMNEFVGEVSDLVEFNQLNVYPNFVEWSGKLIEFDIDFIFTLGEENGIYIKGEMINTDDDFLEMIQKLKNYYEKFRSKWAKVLGNRKLTKMS
jgi:hypothetical protein